MRLVTVWIDTGPGEGEWRKINPRTNYDAYLRSTEWEEKRALAISNAGWCCERCGEESALQVHHRTYRNVPDELPGDLEVLCSDCHSDEHYGI